jgi:hypothetical protein
MTPNTMDAPCAAPSVASDSAKQFASFDTRSGRPSARSRSRSRGWPISQVEFAFFTKPVTAEMAPGMPMPTVQVVPTSRSRASTRFRTAVIVAA